MDVIVPDSCQRNYKGFTFYKVSQKYWEIDCENGENSHEHRYVVSAGRKVIQT